MVLALSLTGCATPTHFSATTTSDALLPLAEQAAIGLSCNLFAPIRWSANDSDGTLVQVHAHNARYKALCLSD